MLAGLAVALDSDRFGFEVIGRCFGSEVSVLLFSLFSLISKSSLADSSMKLSKTEAGCITRLSVSILGRIGREKAAGEELELGRVMKTRKNCSKIGG